MSLLMEPADLSLPFVVCKGGKGSKEKKRGGGSDETIKRMCNFVWNTKFHENELFANSVTAFLRDESDDITIN